MHRSAACSRKRRRSQIVVSLRPSPISPIGFTYPKAYIPICWALFAHVTSLQTRRACLQARASWPRRLSHVFGCRPCLPTPRRSADLLALVPARLANRALLVCKPDASSLQTGRTANVARSVCKPATDSAGNSRIIPCQGSRASKS